MKLTAFLFLILQSSGCQDVKFGEPSLKSYSVVLPDGRTVICVSAKVSNSNQGGVSCDWANAR